MYQDLNKIDLPAHFASDMLHDLAQRLVAHLPILSQQTMPAPRISACVLVAITNEDKPKLLLTKRSSQLSSHAGEMAFVGGRVDDGDLDTAHTALREAYEEVGLPCAMAQIIGYLPYQVSKKGDRVRPVVALISPNLNLLGAESEVWQIVWADFLHFLQPATPHTMCLQRYGNQPFVTPAWQVQGEIVWGLTARVIADLVHIGFGLHQTWYYTQA